MSRLGVGCDVVSLARLEASLRRAGDSFTRELFSDAELAAAAGRVDVLGRLWAAKEAALKCLGRGLVHSVSPGLLEVRQPLATHHRVDWRDAAPARAAAIHAHTWLRGPYALAWARGPESADALSAD